MVYVPVSCKLRAEIDAALEFWAAITANYVIYLCAANIYFGVIIRIEECPVSS